MKHSIIRSMVITALIGTSSFATAATTISIESWRSEDLALWKDKIIPVFESHHSDIKVVFSPTSPTQYDAALAAKFEGGNAGDLITCRPFDRSLTLYNQGNLASLNEMPALENFPAFAKSAWSTDDSSNTFCMPMAAVIHGFIYNKDIFKELKLSAPKTQAEFMAVLKAIKDDGTYTPLAMGTQDQWEAGAMGLQNIGPMYWKGEAGRNAIIDGSAKFTDPEWVKPFEVLAEWGPYMGRGYTAQGYSDSQTLFTLGRAAIYPAGSWEISGFNKDADFEMGAFPPPLPEKDADCFICDHTDIAMGLNPASKNQEAAKKFLTWMGTKEFAELYSNAVPGFFSLSNHQISLTDPLSNEFISWRASCESSIRSASQIVGRGTPNLWSEMKSASANVINGKLSAKDAGTQLQTGISAWYKPQQ